MSKLTEVAAHHADAYSTRADNVSLFAWYDTGMRDAIISVYQDLPDGSARDITLPELPVNDPTGRPIVYDLADLEARAAALGFTDWRV